MSLDSASVLISVISVLGGVLPIILGIVVAKLARDFGISSYAVAISLGIVLSTFYDLLNETADLQLGTLNSIPQIATIVLFFVGFLAIGMVPSTSKILIASALAIGWAVGLGLHGFGEGIVIGYGFTTNPAAYANTVQIVSYGLHKIGEGFTLGTLLSLSKQKLGGWTAAALIAGLPVGLGGLLGFITDSAELSTYAFAIGAGFAAYFIIQFSKFIPEKKKMIYAAVAAGFLFMYLAGLLHQF